MPKKKHQETPEEQSERFRREVQRLIDAGELNPTEAEAGMEAIMANAAAKKATS